MRTIAVDDPSTWPADLVAILRERLSEVHRLPEGRPRDAARDALAAEVDRHLTGWSVLAWHCTRLCPDEIAAVSAEGVHPLCAASLARRVRRRVEAGDMTAAEADLFRDGSRVRDVDGRGAFWFSITRHALGMWSATGLLDLWGGEALSISAGVQSWPVLRRIGLPCIVELAVPLDAACRIIAVGAVVGTALLALGLRHAPRVFGAAFTEEPLGPERVRRVIMADDPDFAILAAASRSAPVASAVFHADISVAGLRGQEACAVSPGF